LKNYTIVLRMLVSTSSPLKHMYIIRISHVLQKTLSYSAQKHDTNLLINSGNE